MNLKLLKDKFKLYIILTLALCAVFCGNVFFNINLTASAATDGTVLEIVKIEREIDDAIDNDPSDGYEYVNTNLPDSPAQDYIIENNDFVMLNNVDVDSKIVGGSYDPVNDAVENAYVNFGVKGESVVWLIATVLLNGQALDISNTITEVTIDEITTRSFKMALDLKELKYIDQTPVTNLEGYYQFIFNYRSLDDLGYIGEEQNKTVGFYLLDEANYVNDLGTDTIEPKLVNTQKIDKTLNNGYELNYFNYNNNGTTDYFGNPTLNDKLYDPTLVYDASKYNFSYSKEIYSEIEYFRTSFALNESGNGIVSFYEVDENGENAVWLYDSDEIIPTNGQYICDKSVFNELGEYNFEFSYVYKEDDTNFIIANKDSMFKDGVALNFESDKHTRISDVELNVFGYQLFYSKNNVNEDEYKSETLVTDFSYSALVESFIDSTGAAADGQYDAGDPDYLDVYDNDTYDFAEFYIDGSLDGVLNGVYDAGEQFIDLNDNETFDDANGHNLALAQTVYDELSGIYRIDSASTNQAPIFTKAYGSLIYDYDLTTSRSYYYYYPSGEKDTFTPTAYEYTNNTRFTENGYYEVVIMYDFQNYKYYDEDLLTVKDGNSVQHMQIFAFEVANIPPIVEIETTLGEDIISGSSVKDDVKISYTTGGEFDVDPYAEVTMYDFNGNLVLNNVAYTQEDLDNGITGDLLTESGDYTVRIYYGPSSSTMIIYNFTIDRNPITGFEIFAVDENEDLTYRLEEEKDLTSLQVTNTPFTINWPNKTSAQWSTNKENYYITASYSYTAISAIDSFTEPTATIDEFGNSLVENGYETLTTYTNLSFDKLDEILANKVFKDQGIYTFYLVDQAGHTFKQTIILDNTNPYIIQDPAQISVNNIVPVETSLTWGTHKAIRITDTTGFDDDDNNLTPDLLESNSYFGIYNSQEYIIIPIDTVEVYSAGLVGGGSTLASRPEENKIRTYIQGDAGWANSITFYPDGVGDVNGESFYDTYVLDQSMIDESLTTNLSTNNEEISRLIMNLDRSQLTADTYGTVKGNADNNFRMLTWGDASNRQLLYVNYLDSLDEYQIESLVYDFYPFVLDDTQGNYPYSDIASLTSIDLTNGAVPFNNVYTTTGVNTIYSTTYGKEITMPGMYVITRTYVGEESLFNGTGDSKVKTYTYYIDRNDVIENTEYGLIGEEIELLMGQSDGRDAVVFDSFLIDTGNKPTIVETNLLPVGIKLPQNKYSLLNVDTYTDNLTSYDLNVSVTRKYDNIVEGPYVIDATVNADGTLYFDDYDEMYKNGIYTIYITDTVGYNDLENNTLNIGANSFSFSFEIKNDKPQGNYYGSPYNNQDTSLLNISSTRDEDLSFMWKDPLDIYTAKVDDQNITITQRLKNSLVHTAVFKIENGVITINPYDMTLGSTLIEGERYKHYVQLFESGDPLALIEAEYTIYIQYEGEAQHYVYDTENFFTNEVDIYVDHTSPEHNLNRLKQADVYLSTSEKDGLLDSTNTVNYENYTFAIDASFGFTRASIEYPQQDTYLIYYRKYDKYMTGDNNLQSLLPDHPEYNNYDYQPTRPRFTPANPAYTPFGYNTGSFRNVVQSSYSSNEDNYYEIVEIDEAGNASIYTVELQYIYPYFLATAEDENSSEQLTLKDDDNGEINALNFNIDSMHVADNWYIVKITDQTYGLNATPTYLYHTPTTDDVDFLQTINDLTTPSAESSIGARFKVELLDRLGEDIVFIYNAPGDMLTFTPTEYVNTFEVTIPNNTASTQLISFKVYKTENGQLYEEDGEGNIIYNEKGFAIFDEDRRVLYDDLLDNIEIVPEGSTVFTFDSGSEYVFEIIDNFGRINRLPVKTGIEIVKEVEFSGGIIYIDNTAYTADDVVITYEPQLYYIEIYENGVLLEESDYETITDLATGFKQVTIEGYNNGYNEDNEYQVKLINTAKTAEVDESFTMYTHAANINLIDSQGSALDHVVGGETTQPVYITWNNGDNLFQNIVNVTRTYVDINGDTQVVPYNDISNGSMFNLVGEYNITVTNALNLIKELDFRITETETITYSILTNIVGQTANVLVPSNIQKSYLGLTIDEYFTVHDYKIVLNPDRNLKYYDPETDIEIVEPDFDLHTEGTKFYKIANEFYTKYFAVTKVTSSTDFIDTQILIEGHIPASGNSYTTINNPETIEWPAFNEQPGNYIYVDYYFNNKYVGRTFENSITLQDAGIYNFYFYDLAGNQMQFGFTDSYEILVLDGVLFTVNDLSPIEDIIYNEGVKIKIERPEEYAYRSLSVEATLNGESILPVKEGDYYLFENYGYYTVTMSALKNVSEEELETTYSFTITNPNEAKLAFEYNPRTGYEIANIVKDGVNVTNSFKTLYNVSTLTKLFLSSDEGGEGNYVITVNAHYPTLKPSETFIFNVWINNETPMVLANIEEGETTTEPIILSFNKFLIYQQLGECVIKLNDVESVVINEETSQTNEVATLVLNTNLTYLVQLETPSGNTILSFKVIKKAPLNTVSVIIIILATIVITFLGFVFFRLRTKMRVS